MKLIVLGAPGVGKGTQAKMLAKHYGVPHISTGAILREHMRQNTDIGVEIKHLMDSGCLVPDELIMGIVKKRVAEADCAEGYILDGYPRTIRQAEATEALLGKVNMVVSLTGSDGEIIKRILGRRTCPNCHAMYHIDSNPPQKPDKCDKCDTTLVRRSDDEHATVLNRLDVYHKLTEPIVDFYNAQGNTIQVDGLQEIDDVQNAIINALVKGTENVYRD